MPRAKPKTGRPARNSSPPTSAARKTKAGEVLTLAEAAAYLRVGEPDVLRLVQEQALPGRKVGDDWRFLKSAVASWLGTPAALDRREFWKQYFATPQEDDPDLKEIVREAYRQRGRPADGEF
jgi:excisionase family DNA binding protein